MSLKALAASINARRIQRDSTWDTCRDEGRESVQGTPSEQDTAGQPETIIEATFTPATAPVPAYSAAEFPPCPVCGEVRYWLASGGQVRCGSKRCASALRFQLIALEFHPVN